MRSLAVAMLLCAASSAFAQTHNAGYVEVGGSAVALSVNYERRMSSMWFGRIGFSSIESSSDRGTDTTYIVPLTVSRVSHPESAHHLELGGGITISGGDRQEFFSDYTDETFATVILTGIAGYRYQHPAGDFQFRAVLTPFVGGGDAMLWGGISFGYVW